MKKLSDLEKGCLNNDEYCSGYSISDLKELARDWIKGLEEQVNFFKQNKENLMTPNRNCDYMSKEMIETTSIILTAKIDFIKEFILEEE